MLLDAPPDCVFVIVGETDGDDDTLSVPEFDCVNETVFEADADFESLVVTLTDADSLGVLETEGEPEAVREMVTDAVELVVADVEKESVYEIVGVCDDDGHDETERETVTLYETVEHVVAVEDGE